VKTSVAVKDEVLPFAICARSTNKNGNKERELAWAQASWSEEGVLSTTQESMTLVNNKLNYTENNV